MKEVNKHSDEIKTYRPIENFHIVLWLVKDFCWCSVSKTLGVMMIAPTFLLAIYITYLFRKEKAETFHNIAIVSWITANSIWMIGEFYYNDGLRNYAYFFFITGLLFVSYYYARVLLLKMKNSTKN